jgi:hypothetical protein
MKLSNATPPDVVNTGMGLWHPSGRSPEHGALEMNINGPYDPVLGSSDIRGLACQVRAIVRSLELVGRSRPAPYFPQKVFFGESLLS